MSVVSYLRHSVTDEEITVKTFKERTPEVQKLWASEIEALTRLKHPCVIRMKGYCMPRNDVGPRVELEYPGEDTLKKLLLDKPPRWFSASRKVIFIAQIVLGMRYIHSKGIIHRDLKPSNILLNENFEPLINDFGLSRFVDEPVSIPCAGTRRYMAPETTKGHAPRKENDIWAFGVILHEILVREHPFTKAEPGGPPHISKAIQEGIQEIIRKCLCENPNDRPSFGEIYEEMRHFRFNILPYTELDKVQNYVHKIEQWERSTGT
jgi:serine/threonine protein kinase